MATFLVNKSSNPNNFSGLQADEFFNFSIVSFQIVLGGVYVWLSTLDSIMLSLTFVNNVLIRIMFVSFYDVSQDGNEVFFRIKRSTQLKKLMNAYCDRQSVDMNSIAFLFDGRRLRAEQTPDEVNIQSTCLLPSKVSAFLMLTILVTTA